MIAWRGTYMLNKVKRVFVIGLDGAGNAVRDAYTPCIDAFLEEAAVTYHAITSIPTISGECWGSLLHGVGPLKHGVTNEIASTKTYDEASLYPSFMKVIRSAYPESKLASFSNWNPINTGIIEPSCLCDFGSTDDDTLTEQIVEYIGSHDPKALFVQLDSIDGAGHTFGYRTPKYYEQITHVDQLVGNILEAIKNAGYYEDSLIILTADHGGGGGSFYSHGSDHYLDTNIFWACKANGIEAASIIEEAVNIKDTAAVVVTALGLECPEGWDCKVPKL